MHTKFWLTHLKGRDQSKGLGVDKRITLEWILGKQVGKVWSGCIWLKMGAIATTSHRECENLREKQNVSDV
jgi:hypothetical protein